MQAVANGNLARKTGNFTPAQIQEVVYSLAIDYCNRNAGDKPDCLIFNRQEVEVAISKIDRTMNSSV